MPRTEGVMPAPSLVFTTVRDLLDDRYARPSAEHATSVLEPNLAATP
ncbi:MAG: hypothetical protein JWN95_2536 [Frankiales bacterium]|nr:hypothetical protein [Frankiales bacterium]